MTPLWDQLERAAGMRGDAAALHVGETALSWTCARQRAARFAAVLREEGVIDGARLAFLAPNGLAYMLMPFAVEAAGGVFVPLNSRLAVSELVEILQDCGAGLLLAAEPFLDIAREVAARSDVRMMTLAELEERAATAGPATASAGNRDALAAIYYTGGTTGRAKGVMLSGERLLLNGLQWAHRVNAGSGDHLLVVAPMFHMVAGLNALIAAMLACDITILPRFEPELVLQTIEANGATNMALVPAMIDMLLAVDNFAAHDLSSLRTLTYGGSPITERTLGLLLQHLPGAALYHVYGQTEGGPTITILGPEYHVAGSSKLRSAGKPIALANVRIVDADGTACPPGATGEIVVNSPSLALGYWNRPDENAAAFQNGWLRTGDAGYLDDDGFLFIVDRIKDMIVTGGENVYAAEVERVIAQHPAVRECAVIGVPSRRWGEAVHAIVRFEDGQTASHAKIDAFCRTMLSAYKCPRSIDAIAEALPLTPANKVDKKALRARFATEERD